MSSDDSLTPGRLETIAHQALSFQRYVFRRAWGIYYAVWTVAIAVFTFGYQIPFLSDFPANVAWIPYAILYGGVGTIAGLASFWIFGNAWRTLELRRAVGIREEKYRRKHILLIILWWVAIYAVIGISFTLFEGQAFTVLYGALFVVEISLVSYGLSTTISLAVSVLGLNPVLYTPLWIITIAAWFYSALYALRHAPDDLVELTHC